MAERAAHLVDCVMPYVPTRQWVLSLPFALRYRMAWDHELTRKVLRCFFRELERFYKKRARKLGVTNAKTGAATVIQRAGGALNLNVHFHTAAVVFVHPPKPAEALRAKAGDGGQTTKENQWSIVLLRAIDWTGATADERGR